MPRVARAISSSGFRQLARRQDDVASRQQLREVTVTSQHVQARVKAGTWQEIGPCSG
jgi:hypothetical protein